MSEQKPIEGTFEDADLVLIPEDHVARLAPMIVPMLTAVAERSRGSLSVEGMLARFITGKWQLWVITEGKIKAIMASELHIQISGRKAASIHFLTGEDSNSWLHLFDKFEEWARVQGCGVIDILARKGWARRLPQMRMSHVFLEKDLT